jgi:hypothetical protein
MAGPELLDFYETAIASPTFSVLVSLGLLERATFSILPGSFLGLFMMCFHLRDLMCFGRFHLTF